MKQEITDELLIAMQKDIKPLNMNGLQGRMLHMKASKNLKKKRNILLIYGHHASIERMYGIAGVLNDYGDVTMPDLPGFGGMDSFHSIGMKPTLDNFADYLAAFIKLRYKGKKVTIVGMSLGFVMVTRMLQRYPELTDRIDILVSIVGFSHHSDLKFSEKRKRNYRTFSKPFTRKVPAAIFRQTALSPIAIRTAYSKTHNAKKKLANLSDEEKKAALDFEVKLWRESDLRTYMATGHMIVTLDNCDRQVDMPIHHISIDTDQYFDHDIVEQHLRVIYSGFTEHVAKMPNHAPSIMADKEEAKPLFPRSLHHVLKGTKPRKRKSAKSTKSTTKRKTARKPRKKKS